MNSNKKKLSKTPNRDKCDLGENFIAPDGGWGWVVCIAGGLSNLCIMPVIQTFGLIFRDELNKLGFSNSEITTIINAQQAVSSCTGLLNGPIFRKFSYRQVALAGAIIIGLSLFLLSIAKSFLTYIVYFSLMSGFGMGISVSATALALNTYFKEKRRKASGFSWTVTGLGPFFMPYVITMLLPYYGVQGVVIILGAISLNSIASALVYQPVKWHVKHLPEQELFLETEADDNKVHKSIQLAKNKKSTSLLSSQYLFSEDHEEQPGYEIIGPGTPMLSRANDGWYGSKLSLTSVGLQNSRLKICSSNKDLQNGLLTIPNSDFKLKPNYFNREMEFKRSTSNLYLKKETHNEKGKFSEKKLSPTNDRKAKFPSSETPQNSEDINDSTNIETLKWYEKIAIFFDLDLLKDVTYVNLMIGITLASFADLNFSTLTPFFLNDFGFSPEQIALLMSLIAGADIIVRFLVPFIVEKVSWDNRIFFLISLVGMTFGRIIIAQQPNFNVVLVTFIWLGICKGLRTVFLCLIIPSHVPLKRLPAASGLQLLTAGIFTLLVGPIVGIIRDASDYFVTLNFLNLISFTTVISWTVELTIRYCAKYKKENRSFEV